MKILLRGDPGFAREALMAWCEANRVDDMFVIETPGGGGYGPA